jgi:hypothetical protein
MLGQTNAFHPTAPPLRFAHMLYECCSVICTAAKKGATGGVDFGRYPRYEGERQPETTMRGRDVDIRDLSTANRPMHVVDNIPRYKGYRHSADLTQ